jgi:hypothetical protein
MPMTLAQAAQATGVNRSTILRSIMSGKISGTKDDKGVWWVEPCELHRVFPPTEAKPKAMHQSALEDSGVADTAVPGRGKVVRVEAGSCALA